MKTEFQDRQSSHVEKQFAQSPLAPENKVRGEGNRSEGSSFCSFVPQHFSGKSRT